MAAQSKVAPLIVIVGETASGKTDTAIKIAQEFNGEIICADSRTVYRNMDVGTAKPSSQERNQVKHHLLDLVEPDKRFTAAEFQKAAQKCIVDIAARGKLPIMIGGSGLYVDSVIYEYRFRLNSDQKNVVQLQKQLPEQLYKIANDKGLDPVSATNKRYLLKLLESNQKPPEDRQSLRENTLVIGLTLNRTVLRSRITNRVENMFKRGLRKEVDELLQRYDWGDPGLTGIGYREFEQYYKGEISMIKVKQKIIYDTLQFAKRQRTWFKRNRFINWVSNYNEVAHLVKNFIERNS